MKSQPVFFVFIFLCAVVIISLGLGKYPVSPFDTVLFILHKATSFSLMSDEKVRFMENIIIGIRLPRIIAASIIGASLSVSGAAYQAMFVNPLVSPGLLGVLSGASFGAALGMVFFENWYAVQISTFAGGFAAVGISLLIARVYKSGTSVMLVLGGIISGALFSALLSAVKYAADPYNQLPSIVYWMMGNLAVSDMTTVLKAGIPALAGVFGIVAMSRHLNILSMGDEEARSLGINTGMLRFAVISCATLSSALTVVMAGHIGWVGLMVPHFTRMIAGPDNETLIPATAFAGAAYLIMADDIARLVFMFEIPIGIVTALAGIPCFVFVLGKARKGWN